MFSDPSIFREFLQTEWPLEAHREAFEAAVASVEDSSTGKIQEARLIEEETVRKLKLSPERNYALSDFVGFLRELHAARRLRQEAREAAITRVKGLTDILTGEERKLAQADDLLKQLNALVRKYFFFRFYISDFS